LVLFSFITLDMNFLLVGLNFCNFLFLPCLIRFEVGGSILIQLPFFQTLYELFIDGFNFLSLRLLSLFFFSIEVPMTISTYTTTIQQKNSNSLSTLLLSCPSPDKFLFSFNSSLSLDCVMNNCLTNDCLMNQFIKCVKQSKLASKSLLIIFTDLCFSLSTTLSLSLISQTNWLLSNKSFNYSR